jgi:two-component system, cell cycle response regulator
MATLDKEEQRNNDLKLLLIEDSATDARLISEMLRDVGISAFDPVWANSISQGLKLLSGEPFDALLLDLCLPDGNGIETIKMITAGAPEIPVIVLTGLADDTLGVEAVHRGAQDYLIKSSINGDLLMRSIRHSIERKRLMTELHKQSIHDDLTGLYNRRGFFALSGQQIKVAEREKRCLWFVLADLDGLKKINDTLGHETGDQAIRDAADILRDVFRAADIIGRIGGDEFAIVAPEKTPAQLEKIIINRIKDKIGAFSLTSGRPYGLSISSGAAYWTPESSGSVDEMLAEADTSMYRQKREKREFPGRPSK